MRDALERTSDRSRRIVAGLHGRLQRLSARRGDRVIQRVGQDWIAWKSVKHGRVFAEVRPHRESVEVFILPSPRELRDPGGRARRAPSTQGWGWFRSRFDVTSANELGPVFRLIRQSYDYDGRARGTRRPPRRAVPRGQTV